MRNTTTKASSRNDGGTYYHLVNDTARTDATLRTARAMQAQAFRKMLSTTLGAPALILGRLVDKLRAGQRSTPRLSA